MLESRPCPRSAVANGVAAAGCAFPRPPPPPPAGPASRPQPSLGFKAQAWPRGRLVVGAGGGAFWEGSQPPESAQWVE